MVVTGVVRSVVILIVLFVCALALPSAASAQATRTWVSGVGDDVNPCSRTAPCKTFAGAISKTATGGEINAIDDGGFGAVTITKSITIDGNGHHASILACSTSGVIVNAPAAAKVTLRDIRINGCRRTVSPGSSGIRFIAGGTLVVSDATIFGFGTLGNNGAGISMETNSAFSRLIVRGSSIHENRFGIKLTPGALTSGFQRATIRRTDIDDNGDGVDVRTTASTGTGVAHILRSALTENNPIGGDPGTGIAIHADGPKSIVRIAGNEIQANVVGLQADGGGQILSAGDNYVFANGTDGAPTGSFGTMRPSG